MKTQFKQVRFNILPDMEEQIQKRIKKDNSSFTTIMRDALRFYLASEDMKKEGVLYPSSGVFTQKDVDDIRAFFKSQPIHREPEVIMDNPPLFEIPSNEPIQKGLIIPDMTKTRVRPDPNKHISIFAHEIRPGDGVVGRLKAAGLDPLEITKAKRNKRRGVEYDKSLEQYFDLL